MSPLIALVALIVPRAWPAAGAWKEVQTKMQAKKNRAMHARFF